MTTPSLPGPPHAHAPDPSKIKVKTTWPMIPPNSERSPIRTERLLLRPFEVTDAEALYKLRSQPEVMLWTSTGVLDKDVDQTRTYVARFVPPNDLTTYDCVVVYLGDASKGEEDVVIGSAGVHKANPDLGWPEVGYMFRKEYWRMGLGTECLQAFTKVWWALPRTEIELEVDAALVRAKKGGEGGAADGLQVPELLIARIEVGNTGSRRVLEKSSFKEYNKWVEPDSRAGFEGQEATLALYSLERPES